MSMFIAYHLAFCCQYASFLNLIYTVSLLGDCVTFKTVRSKYRSVCYVGDDADLYVNKKCGAPGSADTVCPRPPLMTQVQYFVSRIKKRQR